MPLHGALITGFLAAALVATGVSLPTTLKISAYILLLAFPLGSWLARRVFATRASSASCAALGIALALLLHPLTVAPFLVGGLLEFHIWALAAAAAPAWWVALRGNPGTAHVSADESNAFRVILATATVVAVICLLAISATPEIVAHFRVQAIGAQALSAGWPPENPYVAGLPYRDNFGAHLSILAIATGMQIPVIELAEYAAQVTYLWLAVFTLGAVGHAWLALRSFALLAVMAAAYFVLGFSPINGSIYGSSMSASASMTLSPLLGHVGFLLSLFFFSRIAAGDATASLKWRCCVCGILGAATMLARANAGSLLVISVFAYWLLDAASSRNPRAQMACCVASLGVGALAAMVFSLGAPVGGAFSGASFLRVGWTHTLEYLGNFPVSQLAKSAGLPALAAAACAYLVFIALNASFLAPFFWSRCIHIARAKAARSETLLVVSAALGACATLFTFASGGSNFVFLQLAKLCICLVAGVELQTAIRAWSDGDRSPVLAITAAACFALVCVHLYDAYRQERNLRPFSRILLPADPEALLGKPFDIPDGIRRAKHAHFLIVDGDERAWGNTGRASATILHANVRLLVHSQIIHLLSFAPNRATDPLARLWMEFSKLNVAARNGILDLACAVAVANDSLSEGGEIYVLAPKGLRVLEHPSAIWQAESRDRLVWRISRREPRVASAGCS